MTGIVNNTGAVSGIVGTTVGPFNLATATFPAGHIIQVATGVEFNSVYSSTVQQSWTEITGVAITITPTDNNNKIHGHFAIAWGTHTADQIVAWAILRKISGGSNTVVHEHGSSSGGAANIQAQTQGLRSIHDSNGGNHTSLNFFDSPATTSAVTYQLRMYRVQVGTMYINRTSTDGSSYGRGSTIITCMEVSV